MPTLVGQTIRDIAFDEKRQIKMTYWPERWETAPDWRFDWADLKFPPDEGEPVPDAPGVYIFALKPKVFDFLSIGKTQPKILHDCIGMGSLIDCFRWRIPVEFCAEKILYNQFVTS